LTVTRSRPVKERPVNKRTVVPNAELIVTLRAKLNLSQEKLADATGLSVGTVRRIENGRLTMLKTISRLDAFFREKGLQFESLHLPEKMQAPPPAAPVVEETPVTLRRKENALELAREWSVRLAAPRSVVERSLPGTVFWRDGQPGDLTPEQAAQIYRADAEPGSPDAALREALIVVLNWFELVSTAYRHHAADRAILEEQLRDLMVRWYRIFSDFITVVWENFGDESLQPWTPFVELVNLYWHQEPHAYLSTSKMLDGPRG
jgi:transcriptional regulator with XRE-family HTH domain